MGIKDLFNEKTTGVVAKTSLEEEVVRNTPELESAENVREQRKRIERFIPLIDFSDPNNFAHYGSAEAYYRDAIGRIYKEYPYDGTAREKQEFLNESTYLDLYLFDNEYPRTTGYAIMSADGWGTISSPGSALTGGYGLSNSIEYIKVVGGPHTASGGMATGSLHTTFDDSNIYETDIYGFEGVDSLERAGTRESNLRFDLSSGVSTEFWFNKGTAGCDSDTAATATIITEDGDATTSGQFTEGTFVKMTATDGTVGIFILSDAAETGAVASGVVLTSTSDLGTTVPSAALLAQGVCIAVRANLNTNSQAVVLNEFRDTMASANSPVKDKITAAAYVSVAHGPQTMTFTQSFAGAGGNNTVTTNVSLFTAPNSPAGFTGGTGTCRSKQVLFDLWNGRTSGSADYGRLLVGYNSRNTLGADPLYAHIASGSNVWDMTFGGSTITTASLKNTWNHIGFTFSTSSAAAHLETKFYLNGSLKETQLNTLLPSFGEVTGSLIGHIGALQTAPSGNLFFGGTTGAGPLNMVGYGKLSGSLDEFRYWKTKRTERDIQRNWWSQVRGGTNKDIANTELGVYYKFNEGITGTSSVDKSVLDYSGRISNGDWVGYPSSNARNTGSAIVSSSAATSEFRDPIIYWHHDDVRSLNDQLIATGSSYDRENMSSIKDSLPGWISDDEEHNGSGHLDNLTQIVGSYFDTLHLQIHSLTEFKEATYQTASHMKPAPFSDRLLSSKGLYAPEIFVEASILERFANRKEDEEYSIDINDVKNQIYQNIYNNLIFIYKSKGTEKAFRNLIHCYGLGDDVIKFNAYGNNSTFKLDDTYADSTIRKNYIDFNHYDRFGGTVYQNTSSNSETTSVTFVSGTNANFANTVEVEAIFPKKIDSAAPNYFVTPFVSASIFGYHTASSWHSIFEHPAADDNYNFQVSAVRPHKQSKHAYFQISSSKPGEFFLTSSTYSNIYDNQKWNFAVRFKDAKWPQSTGVTGSGNANDVKMEFVGYNTEYGIVKNKFTLTASSLSDKYLTANRRYYIGANRTNFSGSSITETDVKISSLRHWATYLNDSVIKAHSMDPENYGVLHANRPAFFAADSTDFKIDNRDVPESEMLALNWDFSEITGSDASGEFVVEDASSGSVSLRSRYPSDGNLSHIIANQYAGLAYFPNAKSSSAVVDKNYVASSKQRLPEVVNSGDAVNILTQDDDLFPTDPAVSQTFYAFEKSMYGVISQEMLNIFGTIVEFNNLIGEVTNKYRSGYKNLDKLRLLFFEKIQNDPDLDKFIDYYKWIDDSISTMIMQLVPASANVADEIRTVVESHIFERSSYRHQYPMLDYKGNYRWGGDESLLETSMLGINELTYNWKHGHAPFATQATATVTVAVGTAASGMSEKEFLFMTSTDLTTITYMIVDDNTTTVATGDALTTTSDTGTGDAGTHATAVDCIDITGTEASSADVSFTILITTAAGGEHDSTAVTILLDDSATTDPAQTENIIAIGTAGISDAAKAAALIDAINGVSSSLVDLADSGVGQAGVQGVTAAEGTSDTQITLTMDAAGVAGNLTNAITTASGVDVVDVRSFTAGAEVAANTVAVAIGIATATAATAVDCIDLTGAESSSADVSFTILIPTSAGGLGGDAITFLLDDSATTDSAEGENIIAIGTAGISDAAKAAKLILAINAATDGLIDYASSGNGQAGYNIGVTAAEGSSNTQITLTNDATNFAGNITNAITTASGVDVVDVRSFTGGLTADTQNAFLVQLKAAIESANGHGVNKIAVSAVPAPDSRPQAITLTQAQGGFAGNTSAVTTNTGLADSISQTTITLFTGGDNNERTNALWWKERAERNIQGFDLEASTDHARQSINDIMLSFNSASYDGEQFASSTGTRYAGSTYALRKFASPVRMSTDLGGSDRTIRSGYNFPRSQKPDFVSNIIRPGSTTNLQISKGAFKDIDAAETGKPIVETKRRFVEAKTNNSAVTNADDYTGDGKAEIFSPVVQYSSSATTGYITDTNYVEFAGYHTDAYGETYEVPMQGPFTYEHVGGSKHRHIDRTIDPSTTGSNNRPEAWEVVTGNTFTTRSSMDYPPAYASYHRDEIAKRPVNIKNIQYSTSSARSALGNYSNVYEIIQTSDRATNKSDFVKSEGYTASTASAASVVYGELVDYAKPVRRKTKHVIVERFSAPGGPEVAGNAAGGPALDLVSGQYSPYNNLNYRNTTVRMPLRMLLQEKSEQFGIRSGSAVSSENYNVSASYHGIHGNRRARMMYANEHLLESGTVGTGSTFDNYYVQHMIPRSDRQYTWIATSILGEDPESLGYFPIDGLTSSSAGLTAAISFVSSSEIGTSKAALQRRPTHITQGTEKVYTDFVGINSTIIAPISASNFTLGYPLDQTNEHGQTVATDVRNYYNYGNIGGAIPLNTLNQNSFIRKLSPNDLGIEQELKFSLNHILSHRQGPYGHPTWKQIRVGQGALGRYYRKNNLYTNTPAGGVERTMITPDGGTRILRDKYSNTLIVSQSAVTSRCKPITQQLLVRTGERRHKRVGSDYIKAVVVRSSYANNISYFDNNEFSRKLNIKAKKGFSSYDQIKNMYLNGALDSTTSPVVAVRRVSYSEVVFPSLRNSYTNKVRGRTSYQNNFWRDSRTDRTTLAATEKPRNSMDVTVNHSSWCLDADENFTTSTTITGGIAGNNEDGFKSGELQNRYVQFHTGSMQHTHGSPASVDDDYAGSVYLRPGPLYARYHIMPTTASIAPRWGKTVESINDGKDASFPFALCTASYFRGQAFWDAPANAGRYEGTSSDFVMSPRNPFDDSYDVWFSELKAKGQSMSIVPEFRISEHIDFYKNNDYDYTVENPIALQIPGVPSGTAGFPQNESEDGFFKTLSTSDFLRHFDIIKKDHREFLEPWSVTIKCKALKKFIAYDGFYPAERTLQMATQFSKSYAEHVKFDGEDRTNQGAFRSFVKPMFAPGILYNTIKSGMAVDYPIMTGSYQTQPAVSFNTHEGDGTATRYTKQTLYTASHAIASNSTHESYTNNHHHAGWDKRIPFEALVEPDRYLSFTNIVDDEPSMFCNQNVTASWSGKGNSLYKYMMHNFLAESLNFFIRNGKPTSIKSLPQSEWKSVIPGQKYGMRIKIRRSMDSIKVNSGSWGPFPLPQNVQLFGAGNPRTAGDMTVISPTGKPSLGFFNNQTSQESFTMYSRPSAFGPPVLGISGSGGNGYYGNYPASASLFDFGSENGIYAGHTPPYYDGEAWIDVVYFANGIQSESGSNSAKTQPHLFTMLTASDVDTAYQPTIQDVTTLANEQVFGSGENAITAQGAYVRYWRFDQEELLRDTGRGLLPIAPWSYHANGNVGGNKYYGPYGGSTINKWAMQANASLNVFSEQDDKWVIQSKFETPMLNFNHVTSSDTLTLRRSPGASITIPKGMWHQFGRIPQNEEGVFIEVADLPEDWLSYHPSSSLVPDPGGVVHSELSSPRIPDDIVDQNLCAKTFFNGYSLPKSDGIDGIITGSMGSLIDVCGFSTDSKRVGRIRETKTIKEAIVAIPFIIKGGKRRFFTLPSVDSGVPPGPSIGEQINKMRRYILPPKFDFSRNDVPRIAMYIFEFKHKLDKDDLSHIWQNLPPKLGVKAEESYATVSHELFTNELMGDWKAVANLKMQATERSGFESEVRWMVFKAKQRAKTNYFDQVSAQGASSVAAQIPEYSYNWPYDFCSIIEMINIEPEVEFGIEEMKLRDAVQSKMADEAANWLGGTLTSNVASAGPAYGMGTGLNFSATGEELEATLAGLIAADNLPEKWHQWKLGAAGDYGGNGFLALQAFVGHGGDMNGNTNGDPTGVYAAFLSSGRWPTIDGCTFDPTKSWSNEIDAWKDCK